MMTNNKPRPHTYLSLKPGLCALILCWLLLPLPVWSLDSASSVDDPWEGFNRKVFAFNDGLDRILLKPVAKGYRAITPEPVDKGVTNFFSNLGEIGNVINSLLQGELIQAGKGTTRFVVNSTLGIGGLFDVANRMGVKESEEDFGMTLAKWGVDAGPYVVLPLLGPSTVRDGIGEVPDYFMNPIIYLDDTPVELSLWALSVIDLRADLLDVDELVSGDRYVFIRDAYLQRRRFLVTGELPEDDFGDEDF